MKSRHSTLGAEIIGGGKVRFRVWAPRARKVQLVLQKNDEGESVRDQAFDLAAEKNGFFSKTISARAGDRYGYRLNGKKRVFPDPASRFQPDGVHGLSQIIDPRAFKWSDRAWTGLRLKGQVIYEMHIGTFTREGTWEAASRELAELARLGITAVEVMPVADFAGEFGWGYDGVDLFAPSRLYGTPDDFRRFVDQAHRHGLGVILDVVYNHIGPEGNYLGEFSADYFSKKHASEWGEPFNFDCVHCEPVRAFILANVEHWIREFHLDGFRLDALHTILDTSPKHIVVEMAERVRKAAGQRSILLLAEFQPPRPKPGQAMIAFPVQQAGFDGIWNEDFHHSAKVALTSRAEAYFSDHAGTPQELISAVKHGFLYQGQYAAWTKNRRGIPTKGMLPEAIVGFLENHDQIANTGLGSRVHERASAARFRALTALLLLAPHTPMLFQGQEFAASAPFLFFADRPESAKSVTKGREEFLSQFPSLALPETKAQLAPPTARATFERCKLDLAERERHALVYRLHGDLLRLRRSDQVFSRQAADGIDGAVLGLHALVLRFFAADDSDRLLLLNLGADLELRVAPEPLLAPPVGKKWTLLWSSEDLAYGGVGMPMPETSTGWRLPGETATLLAAVKENA